MVPGKCKVIEGAIVKLEHARPGGGDGVVCASGLSRDDSLAIKGFAMVLILLHHLFAFPDRIYTPSHYTPTLIVVDLEKYLGQFGKIGVALFLFMSGYGLYASASRKVSVWRYVGHKIAAFYFAYWRCFLVVVPVGFILAATLPTFRFAGQYSLDLREFALNAAGISSSYNAEWWFCRLYLTLLVLFPLYCHAVHRYPFGTGLAMAFLLSISWKLEFEWPGSPGLFVWQAPFVMGMLFSKFDFYSSPLFQRIRHLSFAGLMFAGSTCVLMRLRLTTASDVLIVPSLAMIGRGLIDVCHGQHVARLVGKYSLQIWLLHTFFCYRFLQPLVYAPRYAPLILVFSLLLSLVAAVGIEKGWVLIDRGFQIFLDWWQRGIVQ